MRVYHTNKVMSTLTWYIVKWWQKLWKINNLKYMNIYAIERTEFAVQKIQLQLLERAINLPNFYSGKHAQTFFK